MIKFLIVIPIVLLWIFPVSAQIDSTLYLLFDKANTKIYKSKLSDSNDSMQINRYHFDLAPERQTSDPLDFLEKNPSLRDTVSLASLDTLDLEIRDYAWLKSFYSEYFEKIQQKVKGEKPIQIFNLNKDFKKITIIEVDSLNNYAIFSPVKYTDIVQ